MFQPKWIIEDFDADNKFELLAEEVKRQEMEAEVIRYIPFEQGKYNKFKDNDCVIVQSSLNLARQLQKEKKWIPGPWLNLHAYECTSYYAYLGQYLLNRDYVMLPRAETKRKWAQLIRIFKKEDDALFIRPSSGFKTFTGKVFQTKNLEIDWEWVEEFTDPESIVIISSVKEIEKEWRFVVADHKVITGSLYKQRIGGVISSGKYVEIQIDDTNLDDNWTAKMLAYEVANKKYECDPIYTLDICKTMDGMFHLLEIGSFSCAGLYDCNLEIIVKNASSIAIREYNDISSPINPGK